MASFSAPPLTYWNPDMPVFTISVSQTIFLLTHSHSSLSEVTLCAELAQRPGISSFPFWLKSIPLFISESWIQHLLTQALWPILNAVALHLRINQDLSFQVKKYAYGHLSRTCVFVNLDWRYPLKLNRWSKKYPLLSKNAYTSVFYNYEPLENNSKVSLEFVEKSGKKKQLFFLSSWKANFFQHQVFLFGFPGFWAVGWESQVACSAFRKCFFTIVCTWGHVQLKDINKRQTTEAGGLHRQGKWVIYFPPEWCQIPSPGREKRGGGLCLWSLFFLGTGKQNVREYCQTTNHVIIPQFFLPLFRSLPLFPYTPLRWQQETLQESLFSS